MDKPFPAYQGDNPYVFVCYAHEDSGTVYPEIAMLHAQGIKLWYDEGISAGRNWRSVIGDSLLSSHRVLFYISKRSLVSDHCNREINLALDEHKDIVPVYLEDVELTSDLKVGLNRVQALHRHEDNIYRQHLIEALSFPVDEINPASASDEVAESVAPTVAVLPFENRSSGSENQDYVGESLSNEIWDRLAQVSQLRMISMRTSKLYENATQDIREVAHLLTANFILDGSVRQNGPEIHVSVSLIAAETGMSIWAERFVHTTESIEALFELYDELADEVTQALNIFTQQRQDTTNPTVSLAAYNLVQQAKYTPSFRKAISLAESAIKLEPEYALAHVTKANAIATSAEYGLVVPVEGFEEARRAAQRSIDLDPRDPLAYSILGFVHARLDLDFHKALKAYQKAEGLGATAEDLIFMQDTLLEVGRYDEGLALSEQWELSDPLGGAARLFSARFLHRLGRIEEAREKFEEALRLSPKNPMVFRQAIAFYRNNLRDLERVKQIIELIPQSYQKREYAYLALANGNPQLLRDEVEEWVVMRSDRYVSAREISLAYYALGDFDQYIEWFEVMVQNRENANRILDFLSFQHPDYWERFNDWAVSDKGDIRERLSLIATHRALIEQVTRKMFV